MPDTDEGTRPEHAGLLGLMDRMDAELDRVRVAVEPTLRAANDAARAREYATAAALFRSIAAAYREARLPGEADTWERRALDCDELSMFTQRRARRGR